MNKSLQNPAFILENGLENPTMIAQYVDDSQKTKDLYIPELTRVINKSVTTAVFTISINELNRIPYTSSPHRTTIEFTNRTIDVCRIVKVNLD